DAVNQGLDGIIVYVHKKGQQAEFYASGWHNRDKKIPANPKALFKIASIGKLYNAAAVAKLVANGTLVLDQTLGHYLPSLVGRIEHADEITLRMLVQHRSGIPNYTDHKDFDWGQALGGDDRLNLIIGSAADFKPNSDYEYSNTNYLLLLCVCINNIKLNYITFSNNRFPHFIIFSNHPEWIHFSYIRFIENQIRNIFVLDGIPIKISIRGKKKRV
ncbi:MAG: serine hydrolase, partial [Mycoplasmataceae bacterium]|nr:serine hydrolase [Mycoplasmataceae bacterium]